MNLFHWLNKHLNPLKHQKQDRSRLADVTRCSPGVSSRWAEHMVTVEAAGFPEALVCLPGNYLRALGRRGGLWESHLRSARCLKDLKRLRAADEAPSSPPASFPRLLSSSVLYHEALGWVLIHVIWTFCLSHSRYCGSLTDEENTSWAPKHMTLFDLLLELDPDWQRRQISRNEKVFPFGLFTQTDACLRDWHDLSGNGSRLSDLEEPGTCPVVFSPSLLVFYCK